MPSWAVIVSVLLTVHLFALEALAERAKRTGKVTLYRAPIGLRLLLGAAIVAMAYGAAVLAISASLRQDWWVSALLLALAIFCASQWPPDLEVSNSGVSERKWLGLRVRTFQWQDVASATLDPTENSVWVVTKSGATIKHTMYHIDRAGFIAQLKTYCLYLANR